MARKNPALTPGAYVAAEDTANISLQNARLLLLDEVKRTYPLMLRSLRDDVSPKYEPLDSEVSLGVASVAVLDDPTPYRHLRPSPLKDQLDGWAARHAVSEEWLLGAALHTVCLWNSSPSARKKLAWAVPGAIHKPFVKALDFEIRVDGWRLESQNWASYRMQVLKAVEEELATYSTAARKHAKALKLIRAPHKYSQNNLKWFVLYQFAGNTSSEIANLLVDEGRFTDDSTILKGVKAAGRLLGWRKLRVSNWKIR